MPKSNPETKPGEHGADDRPTPKLDDMNGIMTVISGHTDKMWTLYNRYYSKPVK